MKLFHGAIECVFVKTISHLDSTEVDMWEVKGFNATVSIGVPHGRDDIVTFIARSMIAGQRVMREFNIKNIKDFKP